MNQFLSSDNIVNIILFIAGYAISAVYSYWRNRKGRWIVVEKVSESFVFTKPQEMKDKNAIEIRVGDKPINSLVQTQFLIKNTGADITDPIVVTIIFKNQDSGEIAPVFGVKTRSEYFVLTFDSLELHRPFFNSSYAYKDIVNILVYSEHSLTLQVKGSGIGWKAKYVDKVQQQKRFRQVVIDSFLSAVGLARTTPKHLTQKDNSSDDIWIGRA